MFKEILKIFKRKEKSSRPKALVFVDYEHWFFCLKKFYNLTPDIIEWRKELEGKYEIVDLIVFADFIQEGIQEQLNKIRLVTNSIIETRQATDKYKKDMTDFVMLDSIYQAANEKNDVDAYIIVTGDAHFQSVVKYLKQKRKRVVIYGVKNGFSNQLKTIADEAIELPVSDEMLKGLYPLIVGNMNFVSGKFNIVPTYAATARTLSKQYDIPEELFRAALTEMLRAGLLYTKEQRVEFNKFVTVLSPDWEKLVEAGLWEY